MPKASEVATELRKLADSLDKNPESLICKAWVSFHCDAKDEYVNSARLLPRPLKKSESDKDRPEWNRIKLEYQSEAMDVWATVRKSLTCTLVEPAKPAVYKCDPILSPEEDAELEVA